MYSTLDGVSVNLFTSYDLMHQHPWCIQTSLKTELIIKTQYMAIKNKLACSLNDFFSPFFFPCKKRYLVKNILSRYISDSVQKRSTV